MVAEFYASVLKDKPPHIARYAADVFFGSKEVVSEWTSRIGILNPHE